MLFFVSALLFAQVQQDTVSSSQKKRIHILNSDYSKTIQSDSGEISRFKGNVNIEHNGVIMFCDSAVMFNGIFEAFGHTKVINGTTVVTGDIMTFNNFTSKADVKGRIVYLTDGSSTLRTTRVDFNTETEIGYFENEGTIVDSFRTLESKKGYYYSKIKEFEFIGQVQSDTKEYVLQSDSMKYNTDTKIFTFFSNTHIWSDNGYLYCDKGWYDSDKDIMFFYSNSYMLSKKQEIFADSIYYENKNEKGRLYSNIQVTDTAQRTIALADFADFDMSTEDFLMRKNPSIIMYDDKDSTFLRADTLYSVTRKLKIPIQKIDSVPETANHLKSNDIPSETADSAATVMIMDSIPETTDSAATVMIMDSIPETADSAATVMIMDSISETVQNQDTTVNKPEIPIVGTLNSAPRQMRIPPLQRNDSVATAPKQRRSNMSSNVRPSKEIDSTVSHPLVASIPDTVKNQDTTANKPAIPIAEVTVYDSTQYIDTTYKELFAFKDVKIYRSDFQVKCDSMYFNNSDSIWRIYHDPVLWEGKKMQITSDSMKFFMKNGDLDHADFNGNGMIVTPEGEPDSAVYFDQIKAKNMKAYLKNRKIDVFEAFGNVQTIAFSLNELTMNKAEAASLKMLFVEGKIRRMSYYNDVKVKNDPLFLVKVDDTKLPGYKWCVDLRPASGTDVLNRLLRQSEREVREALTKPDFPITKRIDEIEKQLTGNQ
jgi:lipopolysaccharide export system protein LptA